MLRFLKSLFKHNKVTPLSEVFPENKPADAAPIKGESAMAIAGIADNVPTEVADLFKRGALVNMIECGTNTNGIGLISNYINLIAKGEFTGPFTPDKSHIPELNYRNGKLVAVAMTAVINSIPVKLYNDFNNVVFLIDPQHTDIIAMATRDAMSYAYDSEHGSMKEYFNTHIFFNGQKEFMQCSDIVIGNNVSHNHADSARIAVP